MAPLTERRANILKLIVDGYVSTGTPVPSMVLAREASLGVSPATIRNDMVALEQEGYITRPHTSAGGVPSDKGYRYFIEDLQREGPQHSSLSPEDIAAMQAALERSRRDIEEWTERAVSILAGLLRTLSFVSAPRAAHSRVKQIELLLLQDFTAMLVVILQETSILKQVINLDKPLTQDELLQVRNRVAEWLDGKTAPEIMSSAPHFNASPDEAVASLESTVVSATVDALQQRDALRSADYSMEGLGRLLGQPEFAEAGIGAALADSLENRQTLAELSRSVPEDGSLTVLIGGENPREEFQRCSIVMARYGLPEEGAGVIGLIGPTRMSYRRALPVVDMASSLLTSLIADLFPARN
ncbi:MAG: heat-inducible transcriptional repressor HrcA [Chloroflexota bacterium]